MNRDIMLARIEDDPSGWDIVIIGGGATGLGCAVEAATRGYRTLLLEQDDFAKGTSSRSTKLVHGGVRYLQQGNVSLVLEALRERGILRKNAPHLVHDLPFVVPNYDWWEAPFYGVGLKMYDLLAGKHGFGKSRHLSLEETRETIPTLEPEGLRGGILYYDGQFDDARLAINLAQTAAEQGAALVNYCKVTGLLKTGSEITGVRALDMESGKEHEIKSKSVINATGIFTDSVRKMDDPDCKTMMVPSQGVHVVLDRTFMPGDSAIMIPHTDDGRILFAIPWHDRIVVGTTDTELKEATLEPRPLVEEISFILQHAARYLTKDPRAEDVQSMFAGIRPLVTQGGDGDTKSISRDHTLHISNTGLVTITGGKWTTYRKMSEDTIDHAALLAELEEAPSVTRDTNIHGYHQHPEVFGDLADYGSDAPSIQDMIQKDATLGEQVHPDSKVLKAQIVWAVQEEMARTVEDVLSRRTRSLLLSARTSIAMAPAVASLMAKELGRDEAWETQQVADFNALADGYYLS